MGVRPKVKKPKPWHLFKYGVMEDCLNEFQLKEKAYCRVFRNLIEIVFLKDVDSDTVGMMAFLVCHVEANLYVNTPTDSNYKHLTHIGMVSKDKRKPSEVARLMASNIRAYPSHFVCEVRFHAGNSIFNSHHINRYTLGRIMEKITAIRVQHVHDNPDATL